MPIQGFVKRRKHQFGRQAAWGTKVPAVQAHAFKGTPSVDLAWTDPDVDTGSIDPTVAPHREAPTIEASLTDPNLAYNTLPRLMSAFFGGGETAAGGGTAKTWVHEPSSTTPDTIDPHTYEFGDDVTTDWFQLGDGILTSLEVTGPEGLGALTTSMTWKFGSAASTGSTDSPVSGTVPTPDLDVETNPAYIYLKDIGIYIGDDPDYLEAVRIADALHTFTLRLTVEVDEKRFANADQSFDADGFAIASRAIELECSWAKTDDTVGTGSESDHWFSDQAVDRYVMIRATSTVMAQTPSTPYSWELVLPMRYYTRAEGESGGNTMVVLTGHAFYDPDAFEGVFRSTAVTTVGTI